MNKLRHALAVIEDRTDTHIVEFGVRAGGIRAVCVCGWEGSWQGGSGDNWLAVCDAHRDAREHLGIVDGVALPRSVR